MTTETIFRGKRTDNDEWVEGNLFIPNQLVAGVYICPNTTYFNFLPSLDDKEAGETVTEEQMEEARKHGISLGHFHQVKLESIGKRTGFTCTKGKKNFIGKPIYEGDVFREDDDDQTNYKVVMWIPQRGAFYMVDVSHYSILQDNNCENEPEFEWLFRDADLYDFSIDVHLAKVGTIHDRKQW